MVVQDGAVLGASCIGEAAVAAWEGPVITIVEELQERTVDLVIAGHAHRIANTMVGRIPVVEGVNAGGSYSVGQLLVRGGDVGWVGGATRVAKTIGVTGTS